MNKIICQITTTKNNSKNQNIHIHNAHTARKSVGQAEFHG